MPNNILIIPGSASIQFSGSGNTDTIRLQVEASGSVAFYGNSGSLFSIADSLSGSLMSVNDISGLPILEVFSDDRVVMGTFNRNTLIVTGSRVAVGKSSPSTTLDVSGSTTVTGSFLVLGTISGSVVLPTGLISSSAQLPTGIVSSSTQINNYNIFTTTGSNTFNANQTISGSLTITQNLTVLGSSSISYVSQSTLNIGTNLVTVNVQNPSIRFGGLAVIDSGSSPQRSGSLLFDSVNDQWIFIHQNQTSPTSSILIMGPQTFNNIGNETTLTTNYLPKSTNAEHIGDSQVFDNGTNVGIGTATPGAKLHVQGNVSASSFTGSLLSTNGVISSSGQVSYTGLSNIPAGILSSSTQFNALSGTSASFATTASFALNTGGSGTGFPFSGSALITGSLIVSGSGIGINIRNPSASLHVNGTTILQQILEKATITTSAPPITLNYDTLDQSILFYSASTTNNWTWNIRGNASTQLNNVMYNGQSLTVTLVTLQGNTPYAPSTYQIDGTTVAPIWQGGTPGAPIANSLDVHTLTIIKNANASYNVIGSVGRYATASIAPPIFPYTGTASITGSLSIQGLTRVEEIIEKVNVTASAPPSVYNIDLTSGSIFFNSASTATNWTLNFRGNAGLRLNDMLSSGESIITTILTFNGPTAYSASSYQIDGATVVPRWQGGIAGTGNINSLDAHQFTIIKVASASYHVLGSITKYT